jgi:3-oxosteroid 1-dehydrogenase
LIEQRKIPVFMEHRAVSLVTNSTGAVVGLQATNEMGNVISIRARRGVVFGTGGFTQNAQMCLNYLRGPIFGGCTVPTGEGDLIPMASAVRAKLANMNNAWWRPIILEQALQFRSVPSGIGSTPGDSMVVVNGDGRRCVDEKIQYNERGQAHFAWDPTRGRYPNLILFMIYDQSCRDRFGGTSPLIFKPGVNAPYVLSAPTLAALAQVIDERLAQIADRTGNFRLDPGFTANLNETILRFNLFAESGKDLDFHRGEVPYDLSQHGEARGNTYPNVTMKPIGEGPYYAVMVGGGTLDTKGGPKINPYAQMLDVDENPIAGLYGAGNCVASPSGQAYWAGGSTIGLAMVFGGLAGNAAAAAPKTKTGLHA